MNEYQQSLYDAIFSDTWEKFVSHKDFPKFYQLVWIKEHHESSEWLEQQLEKVANDILVDIGAR
jgi:hypothetical protein